MSSFKNYLQSLDLSKSTVQHYSGYVLDFLSFLDQDGTEPESATAKEIMAYMSRLQRKKLSNKTRSYRLGSIRHFFDFLIASGKLEANPAEHIKIRGSHGRKLVQILQTQELEEIYHSYEVPNDEDQRANRNWFHSYQLSRQRNKTILGLMIYQGLTTAEINQLQLKDVKLREGKIFIAGGRKGAERSLELKPQQIIELMEYQLKTRAELEKLGSEKNNNFYITAPPVGRESSQGNQAVNIWKRLSQEVKDKHARFINFQQVRTSVITHWLGLGKHNLRQVQYMAGHKYVSTTERYLVNQTEDLQKDIDLFHPID